MLWLSLGCFKLVKLPETPTKKLETTEALNISLAAIDETPIKENVYMNMKIPIKKYPMKRSKEWLKLSK